MHQNEIIHINPLKRKFDILFSGIIILILSPVFLLAIIAIKLEGLLIRKNSGPIFYTETRMSQGKPFALRKFRIFKKSTYEPIRASGKIVHTKKLEHTPGATTHTGCLLKKFYLDESPQLLSVLNGDMSLVGPRPWNTEDYNNEIQRGEFRKKVVKAGLTGSVQIHKLDAKKYGGEHKLDWDYIKIQQSKNSLKILFNDIKLLAQSVWFMLKGQGL